MASAPRALVTGIGRGIGRAIAERLLEDGWSVTGVFNASAAEAERLAARHERLELIQADLGRSDRVSELATAVARRPLAALVNNAGVVEFEQRGSFDAALWQRSFAVNLHAPAQLGLVLGQHIEPGGAVVNIASTDALAGSYSSIAYAASKAALLSVSRSLANVLGPRGVRVNAVLPGWIDTEMADKASSEARTLTPLGRLGRPDEVASCVAWLLSEESSFVTGAGIVLDGGLVNVDYTLLKEADATQ